MAVSLVVIIQKMCRVDSFASPAPPTLFCSKRFCSDIPCGVFLRVSLVVPGTDRGAWDVMWDSWDLAAGRACAVCCTAGCHTSWGTAVAPREVQATKPSLVILADRKEWMMKTIGLGHEWRSSCWNVKGREHERFSINAWCSVVIFTSSQSIHTSDLGVFNRAILSSNLCSQWVKEMTLQTCSLHLLYIFFH